MDGVRHDWYQTETSVTLNVMKRGMKKEDVRVHFTDGDSRLHIDIRADDTNDADWLQLFTVRLAGKVVTDKTSCRCTPAKVEVILPKKEGGRWESLCANDDTVMATASSAATKVPSAYPTSHTTAAPKNWDQIEKQAIEEDEKQEVDGDAAVNRLFQTIYKDASDETKRAMIKSFTESSGTVLSTNWDDVGKGKVKCKPPDSMEYKEWER